MPQNEHRAFAVPGCLQTQKEAQGPAQHQGAERVHAHTKPPGWAMGYFSPGLPQPYCTLPVVLHVGNCESKRKIAAKGRYRPCFLRAARSPPPRADDGKLQFAGPRAPLAHSSSPCLAPISLITTRTLHSDRSAEPAGAKPGLCMDKTRGCFSWAGVSPQKGGALVAPSHFGCRQPPRGQPWMEGAHLPAPWHSWELGQPQAFP